MGRRGLALLLLCVIESSVLTSNVAREVNVHVIVVDVHAFVACKLSTKGRRQFLIELFYLLILRKLLFLYKTEEVFLEGCKFGRLAEA